MASDVDSHSSKSAMTVAELVAFTKKELDADAERQAKVSAASAGELPQESQTGATLDLSHKNIRELPVEVIFLIRNKVERLALSHNPQIAVPSQIVQCDRLRYLNIRWNSLKYFPEAVLQLSALEILDISKNKIIGIPEGIKQMTSLKFLAVARNRITRLPLALGDMASLTKLKFDENPIEFPPPDALKISTSSATLSTIEPERDGDACQRVKRFLRSAALRERVKTEGDEQSESNAETPRPPRRTIGGRFPVRPSVSTIDNIDDLRSFSPAGGPPPIPQRSQARVLSSQNLPTIKRPGIAPLLTGGNDISRSRSETVSSSASLRARRQGIVPPKHRALGSVTELSNGLTSSRSSTASTVSTIKPTHSRNTSTSSTLNGFLAPSSGGETSSGATSPIDGPVHRNFSVRRLSSLPEDRNSKLQRSDFMRAAKRLLFSLVQLYRPIKDVAVTLKQGTPRRSTLERQLFSANAQVEELGRLIERLESGRDEGLKREQDAAQAISFVSTAALKGYSIVALELKKDVQKMVQLMDAIYVRALMFQIYTTMVEARNICSILGFKTRPPGPKSTPRISRAWSSRTVTPTQVKPPVNRRLRGATILQSSSSNANLRAVPPPVPLNGNISRTNTMTSLSSAATPRSGESFTIPSAPPTATLPSRSNTMRSNFSSSYESADESEQFDRIFLKLQLACELTTIALPQCHAEITVRKDNADQAGQSRSLHAWSLALTKCNAAILAKNQLSKRLSGIKLKDPSVPKDRDFWQLCDSFVKAWAELVSEVKELSLQRNDMTTIRAAMRSAQRAVKDASKTVSDSPTYHAVFRGGAANGPGSAGPHSLAPPFPAGMTAQFGQAIGQPTASGYVTPVPATPLSAALGPAVQATVASTSTANQEYFQGGGPAMGPGIRSMHERVDTVMQPNTHLRRQ